MTNDLYLTQEAIEMRARAATITRFKNEHTKKIEKDEEASTYYGAALMKRAIEGISDRIMETIAEAKSGRAGTKMTAVKYMEMFEPDVLAFFTAKVVLDRITKKAVLQDLAINVSKALEDELRLASFEEQKPWLLKSIMSEKEKTRSRRRGELVSAYNRYCDTWVSWSKDDKLHLGMKLIDILMDTTGFVELASKKNAKGKTLKILIPTQKVNDFIENNRAAAELLSPIYLPMVVPPVDWTGPRGGGYLTHHTPTLTLIKTQNRNYLEEIESISDQMQPVYDAVNTIQKTPWKVNERVLVVFQMIWERGLPVGDLPSREDIPKPPLPFAADRDTKTLTDDEKVDFKRWKKKASAVYDENVRLQSKRRMVGTLNNIATEFSRYEAIYFPVTMDFRGRCYSTPMFLNPQSNDLGKGLLEFSDGKPLGTNEAACELAIHGANCFGYDKASMQERVDWVVERSDMICRVATDPLGDLWWAKEADDPFSFAAFCEEWAGYCENGYDHVSYIPIAKDGACNGLQHLSSCLLDRVGGAQVNILPSDKPADIYQTVADKTIQKVKDDLASTEMVLNTHNVAQLAAKWLEYGITRKTAKRCTMTRVYGSTLFSARAFVQEYLTDTDAKRKGEDRDYVSPLHELEFPASVYLAQHVWASINETVVAAQTAMDWMQDAARELAKENLPIVWTTTDGLPVMQSYPDMTKRRLKTKFGDKLVYLTIQEANNNKLDRRRQGAGVSPNVVHSWDSAHLRMTVNLAADNGVTHFGMIHDSFSCHASDIEMLGACTREAFVWIYEDEGPLQRLKEECETMLGRELPPLPPRGDLDIRDVLHSEFFFS